MATRPASATATTGNQNADENDERAAAESLSASAPSSARVGIGGTAPLSEKDCEGLREPEAGQPVHPTPSPSMGESLSIRSDWSCDDFSPGAERGPSALSVVKPPSPIAEEGGSASSEQQLAGVPRYANALRSGRRTLTRHFSSAPIDYGVHSIQNVRPEMEDAHMAVLGVEQGASPSTSSASPPGHEGKPDQGNLGSFSFFGVFDGHGGSRAAEFTGEQMFKILCRDTKTLSEDPAKALETGFCLTESEWLEAARTNEWMDGTTAAVALVDRERKSCVVGNVGDSEILLGTRLDSGETHYSILTEVHHLKRNAQETARVQALGGRVWHGRLGHPTISPQVLSLSVSRAIGDMFFKDATYTNGKASGLVADPFVTTVEVCAENVIEQFLLLGCDGLWDTVSYKKASDFAFSKLAEGASTKEICEALTKLASSSGSCDNITVMLAVLRSPAPEEHSEVPDGEAPTESPDGEQGAAESKD